MYRLIFPVLLILLIDLLIDLYFFQSVRTAAAGMSQKWLLWTYVGYGTLTLMTLLAIGFAVFGHFPTEHARYYIVSLIIIVLIPKILGMAILFGEDLTRIVGGLARAITSSDGPFWHGRRKFVSNLALITASVSFGSLIYGMVKTAFDFTVRKRTVSMDDLPEAFNGLRIAQISDIHTGSFSSPSVIAKAVDKLLAQDPDIIFFTGDLVNNKAAEAEPFLEELKRLSAPLGVYSVLGNHDYGDYAYWPNKEAKEQNLQRLKEIHGEAGWKILLNENSIIHKNDERIAVVGVENWGASMHFPKHGDLDKAVAGAEHVPFKILLSHDPSHWDAKVRKHPQKFQLTLSGHTHGFQFGIEIPGFKWSPSQYLYKQWAGLYKNKGEHLYVNRGLGFLGYMGRVGIAPEITVLELHRTENAA